MRKIKESSQRSCRYLILFILCLIPDELAFRFEPHLSGSKVQALSLTPDWCLVSESWWHNSQPTRERQPEQRPNPNSGEAAISRLLPSRPRHPGGQKHIAHTLFTQPLLRAGTVDSRDKAVNTLDKNLCLHGAYSWMERWVSHTNDYNIRQKNALGKQKYLVSLGQRRKIYAQGGIGS